MGTGPVMPLLAEAPLRGLPGYAKSITDLDPRCTGSPRFVGHPCRPTVGDLAGRRGRCECTQGELAQLVSMQVVDGNVQRRGSGADHVLDCLPGLVVASLLSFDVHTSRVPDAFPSVKGS